MATKCKSCNCDLETGSTFCQNCGTPVALISAPAQAAQIGAIAHIERAVYFRVARAFSWILLVVAIAGFLYSAVLAVGSAGDLLGGKQSVSKEEVQSVISNKGKAGKDLDEADANNESDPKLIGEYETELARLVALISKEERRQMGSDDQARERIKQLFRQSGKNKKEQLAMTREARELISEFAEKDRGEALGGFIQLEQQKEQLAVTKQIAAKEKFVYLGGAALMTAMLITLVSMVLVLLTIERNTRTK